MTTEPEAIPAETELLPCPFCDGAPDWINGGPGNHFIMCTSCRVSTDDTSLERCIAAWNRRASRAPVNGAEAVAWGSFEKVRERLVALREGQRRKMNDAGGRAEMAADAGDMSEVSINSTESERHREAFVALNVALGIFDELDPVLTHPAPASPDAEMVDALVDSLRHSFITSQSDGSEDEYRLVAQFKTLPELQQAYAALMDILSKHESDQS